MAFKHQTKSYREDGKWVCWCDGLVNAPEIAAHLRSKGFKVKRQGFRVFVLASELKDIQQFADGVP